MANEKGGESQKTTEVTKEKWSVDMEREGRRGNSETLMTKRYNPDPYWMTKYKTVNIETQLRQICRQIIA
jgi:hypothetical protein